MRYFAVIIETVIGCLVVEDSDGMDEAGLLMFLGDIEQGEAQLEERIAPFEPSLTISDVASGRWFTDESPVTE